MQWQELRSHLRHLSENDLHRIQEAFLLGQQAHEGQKRKSGEPYFVHPIAVAHMLASMGADRDTIIAALLHDTIEDTDLTLPQIRMQFGDEVAELIDGVTKLDRKDIGERPTLDEQIETLRKMFTLMQQDVRIMVIKLIDRLHNMQTVEFLSPERKRAQAQETLDVYVKIADRLSMQDIRDELEMLSEAVLNPELSQTLLRLRMHNEERAQEVMGNIRRTLTVVHPTVLDNVTMKQEYKTWQELAKQHERGKTAVTGLSDLIIVFITADIDECYRTLGALHQEWQRETLSFQDYINSPLINGYRGLHTTVILKDGTRVRCKIRTAEMHSYARRGITTVCFEKSPKDLLHDLPWASRISAVADDTIDRSAEFWENLQNDILGESIAVHGPHGEVVNIPRTASALDGVFFIAKERAIYAKDVKVNGQARPYGTILKHGDTLSFAFGKAPTFSREWLQWVSSGLALAMIRNRLATEVRPERIAQGKEMLQQILDQNKRGFLEEFREDILRDQLLQLGCSTFEELYLAIADGKVDPEKAYETVFALKTEKGEHNDRYDILYVHQAADTGVSEQIAIVLQHYYPLIREQRTLTSTNTTRLTLMCTHQQAQLLRHELSQAGAQNIQVIVRSLGQLGLLCTIILLWALNPIIARHFLDQGMTPLTLLTLRMLFFSVLSVGFFLVWYNSRRTKVMQIPQLPLLALPPALATFALAACTYIALATMPPSVHLTILRFNVLLVPIVAAAWRRLEHRRLIAFIGLCLFTCIAVAAYNVGAYRGVLFSILSLVSYVFYSMIVQKTLQENKIGIRYPLLLFYTGLFLGLFGLLLVPFQSITNLIGSFDLPVLLYVFFCVFIPHACFYALLKKQQFRHVSDPFIFEIPIAIAAEVALLGIVLLPIMYWLIAIVLLSIFFVRWRHQRILL